MYVGRFLVAGPGVGAYRVSSRSFPNRRVEERSDGRLAVVPTEAAETTENPYVSYDCLRTVGDADGSTGGDATPRVALGNGTHVGAVAGKLDLGYPSRDALASALLATDFERDDYDTPRIAAVVEREHATVGVVRRDALLVETVADPTIVATYEKDRPEAVDLGATDPEGMAREVYGFDLEHPVCAAAVAATDDGFETGVYNGPDDSSG